MTSRIFTLVEPLGLCSAPELVQRLARLNRAETGERALVVDADTSHRLQREVAPAAVGGLRPRPSLADSLSSLALDPPAILPLGREAAGKRSYVYAAGGSDLEAAWQRLLAAAIGTGLGLPVSALVARTLDESAAGSAVFALAPTGMGPVAALLVAVSHVAVVLVPANADLEDLATAFGWAGRAAACRDPVPGRVIVVRISTMETGPTARRRLDRTWSALADDFPAMAVPLAWSESASDDASDTRIVDAESIWSALTAAERVAGVSARKSGPAR